MHPRRRYALLLVALTLGVLALRLAISFGTPLPSYESYFTLLQAESIRDTGLPRYHDALSHGGRDYAFNPAFYYAATLPTLLLPEAAAMKLLANLLFVLLIPLTYAAAHKLTQKRWASLAAAGFAAFTPLLFGSFLNDATPNALGLPLLAAALLGLFDLEKRPGRAVVAMIALTLFSSLVWVLLLGLVLHLLILAAERLSIRDAYVETGVFAFLAALWLNLVVYEDAFAMHGFKLFTQNLPAAAEAARFADPTLLGTLVVIGAVPVALGSIAAYHAAFEQRNQRVFLVSSLGLATLLLLLLRLIPLRTGLLVLAVAFALLAAQGLKLVHAYVRKTKAPRAAALATTALLLLFALTSLLPSLATGVHPRSSPLPEEADAARWLSSQNATVLAAPRTGSFLNHVARVPYVADEQYLLITRPDEVYDDIAAVYGATSTVRATELLERYGATHVYLGPVENAAYPETDALSDDRDCFPIAYSGRQVLVFAKACEVRR